ncbi:molybdopterin molybdotransferase MoeA [Nibricoccus sp. IMCC34717]|uniref:molybdopterin molybdotransferase MoeA n=1 Tax=Nibricoccus sp. IMCC34717 TaxID=3034021 RepID=UPI00384D8014
MHTPAEVDRILAAATPLLPVEDCPLLQAQGRVLRQAIHADRDLPPYDRATMDGYAVAWEAGRATFRCAGMQAAGTLQRALGAADECLEIATGAVIPRGADTVVPYEDCERDGQAVRMRDAGAVVRGQAIHRQGTDARRGEALVAAGTWLTGREIAVAASCGVTHLRVSAMPAIAVVATGDELVDVENAAPAAHQVRRSNDYALRAELLRHGFLRVERLHVRDQKYEVEQQMKRLLAEFDAVLLTGGVSKGKYDFLPAVLDELGVRKQVHGVRQRPGKPFWFGLTPRGAPVFALPGNPVSTWICFQRYALPALRRMRGEAERAPEFAVLAEDFSFGAALAPLVPAVVTHAPDGRRLVKPAPTRTSGDFVGLVGTDGFMELPEGPGTYAAGRVVRWFGW